MVIKKCEALAYQKKRKEMWGISSIILKSSSFGFNKFLILISAIARIQSAPSRNIVTSRK